MSFLKRLREKPAHVKTQYAFLSAAFVTLIIGGIWTTTLPARFAEIGASVSPKESEQAASVTEGIDSFMENMDGVMEEASQIQDTVTKQPVTGNSYAPQGALGELAGWNATNTPGRTASSSPREEEVQTVTAENTTSATATPAEPTQKPEVILIGTTTKKAE